jgi:hypothetical protein
VYSIKSGDSVARPDSAATVDSGSGAFASRSADSRRPTTRVHLGTRIAPRRGQRPWSGFYAPAGGAMLSVLRRDGCGPLERLSRGRRRVALFYGSRE